ncbi:MAG: hypothetical protein U9N14_02165, partial [Pseudomonadota bacterium]|nr:hypothetical protein [Pseudomonadota bacterium]
MTDIRTIGLGIALASCAALPAMAAMAEPQKTAIDVPAQELLIDPAALDSERALGERALMALEDHALGDMPIMEIGPRQAATDALVKNLTIRRGRLLPEFAKAALMEAKALFDPVFSLSLTRVRVDENNREADALRYKSGTEYLANGATSPDDRSSMPCNRAAGCHRIFFDSGPVAFIEFDASRPAGFATVRVTANESPITGADESTSVAATVSQLLPWGASLSLAYDTNYKEAYFINNYYNEDRQTYGSYDRPWASNISFQASSSMPYARNFGPGAEADLRHRTARLDMHQAEMTVQSIVNNTLADVVNSYWNLVSRISRLEAAVRTREQTEKMLARTKRL